MWSLLSLVATLGCLAFLGWAAYRSWKVMPVDHSPTPFSRSQDANEAAALAYDARHPRVHRIRFVRRRHYPARPDDFDL